MNTIAGLSYSTAPGVATATEKGDAVVAVVRACLDLHGAGSWNVRREYADGSPSLDEIAGMSKGDLRDMAGDPIRYALVSVLPPDAAADATRGMGGGRRRIPDRVLVQVWMQEADGSGPIWTSIMSAQPTGPNKPVGLLPLFHRAGHLAVALEGRPDGEPSTYAATVSPPQDAIEYRGAFGAQNAPCYHLRFTLTVT